MPPASASRREFFPTYFKLHLVLLSAALLILAAMTGLAFYEWRQYMGAREIGLHIIAVDDAVERLLSGLIDAETSQRGFLLTGDERYLEPYQAALKTVPAAIADLDRLLNQPNRPPVPGLGDLKPLTSARLEIIRRTIEMRRRGDAAGATDPVLSAEGRRLTDQVRAIGAAARAEVEAERRAIQSRALNANRRSLLVTSAGSLFLAALVVAIFIVISRHTRAREQAMLEAHAARDSLRTTLASIGDGVIATDTSGRVEFANAVAVSLLSLPEPEIVGKPVQQVFRVIDQVTREEVENPVPRTLREGTGVVLNNRAVLVAGGKETPIDDRAAPIVDEHGDVRGTVLIFRDVSARRSAEHTRNLLASIVESSNDSIITQDLDGRVTSWNRGAERMFGYTEAEALGRPTTIIAVPGRNELPGILAHIRAGERIEPYETVRRTKDGRVLHVSLTVSPVRDAAGHIAGASKIVRDITGQVEAAQQLARSNAEIRGARDLLHTTLASIGDAVVSTDRDGRVAFANGVAQSLLGLPEKDLIGKPLDEVFHIVNETTRAPVESPVAKVLREGKIVGLANHTVLLSHDGREIPIDDSGAPIYGEGGALEGIVLVFRDITARRAQENAIRESEERFRNMGDSAPVLIWVSRLDRKCTWFNRPWLDFTGRTMEQELGDGWTEGVHPDDLDRCVSIYHSAFDRREPSRTEYRLRRHDGQWRWIFSHGVPLLRGDGTFSGYIGSCVDITERRLAEETLRDANAALRNTAEELRVSNESLIRLNEELAQTKDQLQVVTSNMAAAVARCSRDLQYVWVSRGYADWMCRPPENIAGRPILDVVGRAGFDAVLPYMEQVLAGNRAEFTAQVNFTGPGRRWIHSVYVPTYARNGVDGWISVVTDITGLIQTQERLREANASLARANEDLERFAFVASHDLQEPLRMITAYAQLLIQSYPGQFDREASIYVENIVDGTRRMRDLLADLLAYTEIGVHPVAPSEAVDLNGIFEHVKQNLKAAIDESGAVVTSDPLPTVRANDAHVTSLIQNLLSNAIKYRDESPPQVHIAVETAGGVHRFAVRDNGIGIDPVYHEQIFEVFKRLHGKKIPGTGVGLAICQRVVERYGGRIWVESQAGQGSVFFFTLPVVAARTAVEV